MISTAAPADAVLAVNIGSSSVKFAAYPAVGRQLHAPLFSGSIQGLQAGGRLKAHWKNAGRKEQRELAASPADLNALGTLTTALAFLKTLLAQEMGSTQLLAVAHRVVHGGTFYSSAVVVTQEVLANLKTMASLAPLHQPHNIHGIEVFTALFPGLPQVACFDTAFHKDLPEIEKRYALPDKLYQEGIHRYGFHGLSYRYVSSRLTQHSMAASGRLVMAHLGNGSSVCGCIAGKSMATSMGFSAAGGLMMGTRSGDIDPGVLLYLLDQGWTPHDLQQLIYFESGLKGVSQISADMRELKASTDPRAQFAIALYEYHVVRQIGVSSPAWVALMRWHLRVALANTMSRCAATSAVPLALPASCSMSRLTRKSLALRSRHFICQRVVSRSGWCPRMRGESQLKRLSRCSIYRDRSTGL